MDIEGFVRGRLTKGEDEEELKSILAERIREFKDISDEHSILMAESVIDEVKTTMELNNTEDEFLKDIITVPKANVGMGKMGVGSRGAGDFFVHRKIAHSRLSEYPFLGGFHVTRATLRDVCVMGADPVAILSDLHLADDGDIGKLFDYTAGVCAVSELIDVPLVAGSTLRVGGDMVLGDRLVSCVGSVGVSQYPPTARKGATEGDIILMTEGAGGGTITTTALYNGYFDVVWDTMNISFVKASKALFAADLVKDVHAMTDVTNGGLRGDAHEICETTGVGLEFYHDKIKSTVAPNVLNMLEDLDIDPLGVSTDSLMLVVPPEIAEDVKKVVSDVGVYITEIGEVNNKGSPILLKEDGTEETLVPLFREAAYTKIKKLVGDTTPEDFEIMKEKVQKAADNSIKKKERVIDYILSNNK